MKIQAINSIYVNKNQKSPSCKGIWARIGQNYLDNDRYCAAAFYRFIDGKKLEVFKDPRNGRHMHEFGVIGMTAKEGKAAYKFLFGRLQDPEGYEAAKKLRAFLDTKRTKAHKHNIMFLEKEDLADVTAKRERLSYDHVDLMIKDYEFKNNLVEKVEKVAEPKQERIPTTEELRKMLTENGVA